MNDYSKIIISLLFIISSGLLLVVIQKQSGEIRDYQSRVYGLEHAKEQIENEYTAKKKDTPQIKTTSINSNSKNVIISDAIYQYANRVNGSISVYYKNLTTGESVIIDGEKKYYMASLYKVILTLYMLDQIKVGKTALTATVGDPPITVEQALNKIVTESNNEYAQALASQYGWENIEKAMRLKLGINFKFNSGLQTDVENIGLLFEYAATSLKISDSQSSYLLNLLKQQTHTSKLPKYLPDHIYVHNKTGELDDYSHDAAIIYTPKANYILIFMSKTSDPADTNEKMALLSKEIYEKLNDVASK